jgi:hypothetical protein
LVNSHFLDEVKRISDEIAVRPAARHQLTRWLHFLDSHTHGSTHSYNEQRLLLIPERKLTARVRANP